MGICLPAFLYVKTEVHNIAVFHDIFFTFHAHFTSFFYFSLTAISNKIIISDYLSTNKSFLKIGVNYPCGLRGSVSLMNRPRTSFTPAVK